MTTLREHLEAIRDAWRAACTEILDAMTMFWLG